MKTKKILLFLPNLIPFNLIVLHTYQKSVTKVAEDIKGISHLLSPQEAGGLRETQTVQHMDSLLSFCNSCKTV